MGNGNFQPPRIPGLNHPTGFAFTGIPKFIVPEPIQERPVELDELLADVATTTEARVGEVMSRMIHERTFGDYTVDEVEDTARSLRKLLEQLRHMQSALTP